MNRTSTLNTIIVIAGLLIAGGTNPLSARAENSPTANHATAPNPRVPKKMTFCGQTVDLDRVDMFERFDRELTSLVYGHSNTLLTIKRANKYFPVMAPILRSHGVPEDVLYLACVESHLNHRAYSPAKAAGVWQFIPSTAKQYGLEVSDEVDERYNLEKATAAACRYLKNGYRKYGNWPTVMASFNGGMGRISSELSKQNADTSFDLYLTEETSRYVFRIMAMKAVFEKPSAFGFKLTADQLYQPVECEIVIVDGPVEDWPTWAGEHGLTYAQLREENPWIRAKKLTNKEGKTYKVRIPKQNSLYRSKNKPKTYNPDWISK